MKGIILILMTGILLAGVNVFAADGDLIVNGKVGIGTTAPQVSLDIAASDNNPYAGNTLARITNTGTTGGILNLVGGGVGARTFSLMSSGSSNVIGAGKFEIGDFAGKSYLTVVGNSGNVGIGTATPGARLEVNTWASVAPPGINPILNLIGGYAGNNTQGHSIDFHINTLGYYPASRIVSTMSTGGGGELQFHTSSWYPTTPAAARMTITSGGNIGIGTTSPSYTLHVNGSAYSSGGWSGSDIRWKKNINPIENALESVLILQGVNYEWRVDEYKDKNFDEGKQIGLVAQDVEKVLPELVRTDNEGYKAISYEKLTAVLVEAIKEQQKKIAELEDKINTLEKDRK